jgi:hypothetical protein
MDDVVEVAPPAPRSHRRLYAAGLVGAGLLSGVVIAGLNVANAQAPTPTPSPAQPRHQLGHGGPRGFGPHKLGGMEGALHGEFTTKAPGGGYQVMAMQVGDVTAVSATSVTVKSEDGYSRTYAVNDDTLVNAGNDGIADVKNGDDVRVLAVVKDGSASAVHVADLTNVKKLRGNWLPPRRPWKVRESAKPSAST